MAPGRGVRGRLTRSRPGRFPSAKFRTFTSNPCAIILPHFASERMSLGSYFADGLGVKNALFGGHYDDEPPKFSSYASLEREECPRDTATRQRRTRASPSRSAISRPWGVSFTCVRLLPQEAARLTNPARSSDSRTRCRALRDAASVPSQSPWTRTPRPRARSLMALARWTHSVGSSLNQSLYGFRVSTRLVSSRISDKSRVSLDVMSQVNTIKLSDSFQCGIPKRSSGRTRKVQ